MFYDIPDGPKLLRETLATAQTQINVSLLNEQTKRVHIERLQRLIDECDRLRPLGPDGKHGNRHTEHCGCDGPEWRGTVRETMIRKVVSGQLSGHLSVTPEHVEQYESYYAWELGGRTW